MQQRLNEALKAKSDALIAGGRAAEEHAKVSSAVAAIKAEVDVWHRRAAEAQAELAAAEAELAEYRKTDVYEVTRDEYISTLRGPWACGACRW